jgi:hypothetical protein
MIRARRRGTIRPLRRTLPAAISTPIPSEEPSDLEPSDFDGEGHPALTNLPTPGSSDEEDDQQTAMTDPLASTTTSVGRRDYVSPYGSPSISSTTSSSPSLQTPLDPIIRLVTTSQKPSSSRKGDILPKMDLERPDHKEPVPVPPTRSLAVTPNATTMDLISNLINMGIEGASLRETNARFWDAVETLRLENPSAGAVIDEAMKTGGKLRVEVDDRYATSTKTPRAPKTSGASSHTTLQVSKPKSPSEPSSGQKPSKKAKSKARAKTHPTPPKTLLLQDKTGERPPTARSLERPQYLALPETAPPRKTTLSPQDHPRASLSPKTEENRTERPLSSTKKMPPSPTTQTWTKTKTSLTPPLLSCYAPTEAPKPSRRLRIAKIRTPSHIW